MDHQNVIIVGAGIGGLAAAGRLARTGYRVTVVEKAATAGGRAGKLVRDAYRFDTGPTLFLMPQVFAETYAALGERMQDHLELIRIDPTYRLHFPDGSQLDLTGDLKMLQTQLEAMEPGSFAQALRFISEGAEAIRSRDRVTSRSISSTRSFSRKRSALRRSPIRSANSAFASEVVITTKRHG